MEDQNTLILTDEQLKQLYRYLTLAEKAFFEFPTSRSEEIAFQKQMDEFRQMLTNQGL